MSKTKVSEKGQVVIPKEIRNKLGLAPGMILEVGIQDGKVILEPARRPPEEIFIRAGPSVTEPVIREAKDGADKVDQFLRDTSDQWHCHRHEHNDRAY